MSGQVLSLAPGSRLVFDGEVAEVVAIDGVRATLRNDRTRRFTAVQISPPGGIGPSGGRAPPCRRCQRGTRAACLAAWPVSSWTSSRNRPGTCGRS